LSDEELPQGSTPENSNNIPIKKKPMSIQEKMRIKRLGTQNSQQSSPQSIQEKMRLKRLGTQNSQRSNPQSISRKKKKKRRPVIRPQPVEQIPSEEIGNINSQRNEL
jgi:hypothetical protein